MSIPNLIEIELSNGNDDRELRTTFVLEDFKNLANQNYISNTNLIENWRVWENVNIKSIEIQWDDTTLFIDANDEWPLNEMKNTTIYLGTGKNKYFFFANSFFFFELHCY